LERDEELCNVWEAAMSEYTNPDMFVALDKTAVDEETMQQTHGQSPVRIPCVHQMSFLHGVRFNLACINNEGNHSS